MPRLSFFYGIGIWMYWNGGVHARQHFHARYGSHAASIALDGDLIARREWRGVFEPLRDLAF